MKRTAFFRFLRRKQFISWSAKTACRILHLQMIRIACGASRWVKQSFTNPFSMCHFTNRFSFSKWLTEQWSEHMSKAKLYESVFVFLSRISFYCHFFIIQHPRQTRKIPTRYTHFGIRHARSIPIPAAISKRPHSHPVGAPLHLLRIPSPPFFILCR